MAGSRPSIAELMLSGETLVLAHRGAMAYAPMNTMAAFELAKAQGADGIELDVQLSSDGHAVVIHDFNVDDTTDGAGTVCDKTLADLQALDAGSWFSPKFARERIPTLDDVFAALGDQLLVNVEIKPNAVAQGGIEDVVARCILRHQMQDRVIVSSFDPHVLLRFCGRMPEVMIGFLYAPMMPAEYHEPLKRLRHEARHPWHDMVDESYMDWASANRYFVNAWTVNELSRALQLKALGVNAVITDIPDRVVAAFSS